MEARIESLLGSVCKYLIQRMSLRCNSSQYDPIIHILHAERKKGRLLRVDSKILAAHVCHGWFGLAEGGWTPPVQVPQFGDTFWLQLNGTAMGTPPACTWATIYYGVHESVCLLANFGQNLLYCGRFIDDMLGIWIPDDNNPNAWEEFKNSLPFGLLEWETSELSTSVDFLDLTISIGDDGRIQFQTYQKPMNLYLYIPHGSAHAPGVLRSLIFGNLRKYRLQNSKKEDYQAITLLFYDRIVARGHDPAMVKDMFLDAAKRLDDIAAGKIRPKAKVDRNQQLFFHTEYHPSISRQAIRQAYESATNNFADVDGIDIRQFTVALSRPQNLRDLLISSRLHEAPGREVSTHLPSQSITNHGQPRSSS